MKVVGTVGGVRALSKSWPEPLDADWSCNRALCSIAPHSLRPSEAASLQMMIGWGFMPELGKLATPSAFQLSVLCPASVSESKIYISA
jgi:hypothetical protein